MPERFAMGVEDNAAKQMIGLLNARLVDTIDLSNAVKQAHWNLKGPGFIGVHELLDLVAGRLRDSGDSLAERCVVLGGIAKGTTQNVAAGTSLDSYPDEVVKQADHIGELVQRFKQLGKAVRQAIATAAEAGDDDTADLFTEVSRQIDKDAWLIGANAPD